MESAWQGAGHTARAQRGLAAVTALKLLLREAAFSTWMVSEAGALLVLLSEEPLLGEPASLAHQGPAPRSSVCQFFS